eukprot:15483573-Alexandrium_andersonii.AAC.1
MASSAARKLKPAISHSHACAKGAPRTAAACTQPGCCPRTRGRGQSAARPGATSSYRTDLLAASS